MLCTLLERLAAAWPAWADTSVVAPLHVMVLRAALAALLSLLVVLACGRRAIGWLQTHFRDPIKSPSADVARLHAAKRATPTMGGAFIVAALATGVLVCGNWSNVYLPIAALLTLSLMLVGTCDDWIKLKTAKRGMSMRAKLAAQTAIALAVALLLYRVQLADGGRFDRALPLLGTIEIGWWFVPLATLVIVGASNAVNLTDGLDGLAGGCLVCAVAALAGVIYFAARVSPATIDATSRAEMLIVLGAMLGAVVGFLRFNCHPAAVFMGNTGSLPLGGLLGLVAVVSQCEWLLLVIGGVFVVETISVIAQIASFRLRGKRIFLCAPLHHHWQLRGCSERRIVQGFWVAAAVCAAVGLTAAAVPLAAPAKSSQLAGLPDIRR